MADTNSAGTAALATLGLDARDGGGQAAMLHAAIEIARRYPRDPEVILRQALTMLDAHPEQAEKAIYSIPYEDRRKNRTVHVEGLSVRTAETLAALWGHLRIGVRISLEDKDGYELEAVAWDMQTNFQQLLPYRVSKWEKPRGGQVFLLDERRMLQVLQSGVSKIKRNVILSVLPTHVKLAYERKVRELLAGGPLMKLASPETIKLVEESFAQFEITAGTKVTLKDLETRIGKLSTQWLGRDIADLRGLYTAIEDGEITAVQAFGSSEPTETEPTAPGRVTVTPATISQGEATGKNEPVKRTRKAAAPAPAAASTEPDGADAPVTTATQTAPPVQAATVTGPVMTAVGLQAEELKTVLDTISQATSEGLDEYTQRLSQEGGAIKRANRAQKTEIINAIAARRATL